MSMTQVVESGYLSFPQNGSPGKGQVVQASCLRQTYEHASFFLSVHSTSDSDSSSDSDDDQDILNDYDVTQHEIKRANDVWNQSYADVPDGRSTSELKPGIKVNFSSKLTCVQTFEDDEESKSCRLGSWKIDADRFRYRIQTIGQILAPVLHPDHRDRTFNSRQSSI